MTIIQILAAVGCVVNLLVWWILFDPNSSSIFTNYMNLFAAAVAGWAATWN